MEEKLEEAGKKGDSLGGIVEILIRGCPPGLGEPVFDKIDADLAKALMGIGSVKGIVLADHLLRQKANLVGLGDVR